VGCANSKFCGDIHLTSDMLSNQNKNEKITLNQKYRPASSQHRRRPHWHRAEVYNRFRWYNLEVIHRQFESLRIEHIEIRCSIAIIIESTGTIPEHLIGIVNKWYTSRHNVKTLSVFIDHPLCIGVEFCKFQITLKDRNVQHQSVIDNRLVRLVEKACAECQPVQEHNRRAAPRETPYVSKKLATACAKERTRQDLRMASGQTWSKPHPSFKPKTV